jgi:hypothetical protein
VHSCFQLFIVFENRVLDQFDAAVMHIPPA